MVMMITKAFTYDLGVVVDMLTHLEVILLGLLEYLKVSANCLTNVRISVALIFSMLWDCVVTDQSKIL
ncbi:hypothetical protein SOVF_169860 [Spinacia oleracea]|nr:hypothetical protein SOVF_169860 [Spinacia oleracea]